MRRLALAGMLLALGPAASVSRAAEVAPDLPMAEWLKAPIALEDFKGQLTAVVFYDDDAA
jgi:hypothetical protein